MSSSRSAARIANDITELLENAMLHAKRDSDYLGGAIVPLEIGSAAALYYTREMIIKIWAHLSELMALSFQTSSARACILTRRNCDEALVIMVWRVRFSKSRPLCSRSFISMRARARAGPKRFEGREIFACDGN